MVRKSTSKRLRFEVFKRDCFTCQYCGAQPPAVVLVADHITPVAEGGETTIDNLLTACQLCNQGKADKTLGPRMVRPDADLLFLETQQEIAELKRYQAAKAERDARIAALIETLQDTWTDLAGVDWAPKDRVLRPLLMRYEPEVVDRAVTDVACKIGTGYLRSYNNKWVAYLHAVARNLSAEQSGDDGADDGDI